MTDTPDRRPWPWPIDAEIDPPDFDLDDLPAFDVDDLPDFVIDMPDFVIDPPEGFGFGTEFPCYKKRNGP
ncbi:MAG: hypothetical protein WBN82_00975 [Porticoccaceae bacterium]